MMTSGPASRSRSAPCGTATGRTSRSSRRTPSASSSACSTATTRRRASSSASGRPGTGTATCPGSARASATATASTARTRPSRATASTPPSCSSTRTPRRSRGRSATGAASTLPYLPNGSDDADLHIDESDDAAAIPKSIVVDETLRLGRRRVAPAARALARDGHLRGARQGLHQAPPGGARGPARHVRGARVRGVDRAHEVARRDHRRAPAGAPHRRRAVPRRARPDELLGLQLDRLPRPARPLRGDRHEG